VILLDAAHAAALSDGNFGSANQKPDQGRDQSSHPVYGRRKVLDLIVRYEYGTVCHFYRDLPKVRNVVDSFRSLNQNQVALSHSVV
jgi:hypothetical protein